jgi:cytochrome bd-type quinol oxidase subunit 2
MTSFKETLFTEYSKIQFKSEIEMSEQFFMGLIIVGSIIKLLTAGLNSSSATSNNSGINGASGTIWGYFLILFAILGYVIITIDNSTVNIANQLRNIPWYFYILLAIICWVLSLNIIYYKQISKNHIPTSYYTWDIWSSVFIIIVTIMIFFDKLINKDQLSPDNQKFIKFVNISIGIILFLNIIIIGIQNTILQNFSVDG